MVSRRLKLAQLVGWDFKDEEGNYFTSGDRQHIEHPKTREKVEKWVKLSGIPIRIIFGGDKPEAEPNVITLWYNIGRRQQPFYSDVIHPPTPWIIIHQISHAIFDLETTENFPAVVKDEVVFLPGKAPKSIRQHKANGDEWYHEVFTNWFVRGTCGFQNEELERIYDAFFKRNLRSVIGKVIIAENFGSHIPSTTRMSSKKLKDTIEVGISRWFEYHCWESHKSADAELWYRSHQKVTVGKVLNPEFGDLSYKERLDNGTPLVYEIVFSDGVKGTAFEDELLRSRKKFSRPDPPSRVP